MISKHGEFENKLLKVFFIDIAANGVVKVAVALPQPKWRTKSKTKSSTFKTKSDHVTFGAHSLFRPVYCYKKEGSSSQGSYGVNDLWPID